MDTITDVGLYPSPSVHTHAIRGQHTDRRRQLPGHLTGLSIAVICLQVLSSQKVSNRTTS
jgi:hypothetical protein